MKIINIVVMTEVDDITECEALSSFMGINIHYDISKGILT
eukprot:CAMPEP_0119261424 /NCGR_PEP_ID=MMETSP1329-20130426/1500_1 /TAXON_ID=114041 /ORGANISM="Genus nov. species nov., Strain RCC1024" /LENGTH=39 /DNA_ID= /DNA_START= /DNA_END= /DNA_ORIENTATION=